ncbi:MAG: efflux transporter outer membrane subunit [Verrucomicrobiota bacterium]
MHTPFFRLRMHGTEALPIEAITMERKTNKSDAKAPADSMLRHRLGVALRLAVVLLPVWLVSCNSLDLAAPYEDAESAVWTPARWVSAGQGNDGQISTGWLHTFRDDRLEEIVDEVFVSNPGYQAAAAQLEAAQERVVPARAARLPAITARGTTLRVRDGNGPLPDALRSNYRLSLSLDWEIDLWGRLKDLDEAAQADLDEATAVFRGARLSLAGITARTWFDYITTIQLVQLAEETRDSFARNLRITERNYKAGDETVSPLSVQLSRSTVAAAERALIRARLDRDEAARSLEVLLGRYPSAEVEGRASLPALPAAIPVGLPSELLSRRPDLVAAEAELRASARRADAAYKDLLPSLGLNADGVTTSDALSRILLDPEYIVWSVATSLVQQVYQGGEPVAAAREALAENEVAIRNYAELALLAFQDVESTLDTERSLAEQQAFLEVELKQANLALAQAEREYSEGLVGILELLESQRRAVNARTDMIELRNLRLRNRVDLHLALGGDFLTRPSKETVEAEDLTARSNFKFEAYALRIESRHSSNIDFPPNSFAKFASPAAAGHSFPFALPSRIVETRMEKNNRECRESI